MQPIGLNNNAYGTTSTSAYNSDPEFNWSKQHNLTDLLGSDAAEFQFYNEDGSLAFDFTFDYASDNAASPGSGTYSAIGTCGDLANGKSSTCTYTQMDDGKVTTGSASLLAQYATSLSYDCSLDPSYCGIGAASTVNSPTPAQDPNWVNADIYEGEISSAAFDSSGFGGLEIPLIHDSPAENQSTIKFSACVGTSGPATACTYPAPVPEPPSYVLFASGLVGLALGRLGLRRRSRTANSS